MQGECNRHPFLVTLPIANKSMAIFSPDDALIEIRGDFEREKSRQAVSLFLALHGIQSGGHLTITSDIPIGKGMASSSADIVASIRAASNAYHLPCSAKMISQIACKIERTDGVMYNEIVLYNPKNGRLMRKIAVFPPIVLLGIDAGGQIDTAQFHHKRTRYRSCEQVRLCQALHLLQQGAKKQSAAMIFRAATISATINQRVLPNPYFDSVKRLADGYGGGVVIAHSGTVIGLLLDPKRLTRNEIQRASQNLFKHTGQKLMVAQMLTW